MALSVRGSRDQEIASTVQVLRQIDRTRAFRIEHCGWMISKVRKALQRGEELETICGKIRRDPRFQAACLLPDLQDGARALERALSRCQVEQRLDEDWARLKADGIRRFRLMAYDGERSCKWARAADGVTFGIDDFPLPHPDCDRYACTCKREVAAR